MGPDDRKRVLGPVWLQAPVARAADLGAGRSDHEVFELAPFRQQSYLARGQSDTLSCVCCWLEISITNAWWMTPARGGSSDSSPLQRAFLGASMSKCMIARCAACCTRSSKACELGRVPKSTVVPSDITCIK